jgi:hypothetical protein
MTDKKKIADLRSKLAPTTAPDKGAKGWFDKDGKPLQAGDQFGTGGGRAPGGGKPGGNRPNLRQPEVSPEKLRKHAT